MAKGLYTQTACILFEAAPGLDALRAALARFGDWETLDGDETSWVAGGPGLAATALEDLVVLVDVVARPWPDAMADPGADMTLFLGWTMGQLGPFTYPGCLERAVEQAWAWPGAREAVEKARAFVRIRTSRSIESAAAAAGGVREARPASHGALDEIVIVTAVGRALLDVPGALAWFVPGGEMLLAAGHLDRLLARGEGETEGPPPFDAWINVRLYDLAEGHVTVRDTVGAQQLDLRDVEAVFEKGRVDPEPIYGVLLNTVLHRLARGGEVIEDGAQIEGPAELTWDVEHRDEGLAPPPRPVLRLVPEDADVEVREAIDDAEAERDDESDEEEDEAGDEEDEADEQQADAEDGAGGDRSKRPKDRR